MNGKQCSAVKSFWSSIMPIVVKVVQNIATWKLKPNLLVLDSHLPLVVSLEALNKLAPTDLTTS
ncbi:CFF_collapsed_G0026160.mRNA.1.CDS.1 [Saccharomyces cerevisiae]|nr:CFF_collapsed_G0026160.mRNA.1.CDS.1 [Saccharomyces cerevisiae]